MNCSITLIQCIYIIVLSSLGTYIGCKLYKCSKPTKQLTTPCNSLTHCQHCQYEKSEDLTEEEEEDEKENEERR